jgi:anti-anti-sigma factor
MSVEIARENHGDVLVLAPLGRLDTDSAADFELAIEQALASGERHLVFDLAGLDYISNAGLRALGRLAKSLDTPSTSLRIAGLTPRMRQLFDDAGVGMLFDFRADRAAALADHPAARGRELAAQIAPLLGAAAVTRGQGSADDERIAELAIQLLGGRGRQTRAVRAMAEGTQVMQQLATAQTPAPPRPAPAPRPGFWRRLFSRRSRPRR